MLISGFFKIYQILSGFSGIKLVVDVAGARNEYQNMKMQKKHHQFSKQHLPSFKATCMCLFQGW
jgi:hypothetical protein